MTTQHHALITQMLEALGTCRIMSSDADGDYTKEVTPRVIQKAISAAREYLAESEAHASPEQRNMTPHELGIMQGALLRSGKKIERSTTPEQRNEGRVTQTTRST